MTTWTPGTPVISDQDRSDWQVWRRIRKLEQQRDRRRLLRRIDYHASRDVAEALDKLWQPTAGKDFSTILDGIVREWFACCHRNKERQSRPHSQPRNSKPDSQLGIVQLRNGHSRIA